MFGKTLPLKEKVRAASAFGGIALASVMAVDMMITGGYQMPGLEDVQRIGSQLYPEQRQPVLDGGWSSDYAYNPVAWNDARPAEYLAAEAAEGLVGADTPADGYRDTMYDVPSEDDLYREIAALYARQDEAIEQRAAEVAEATVTRVSAQFEEAAAELEALPEANLLVTETKVADEATIPDAQPIDAETE